MSEINLFTPNRPSSKAKIEIIKPNILIEFNSPKFFGPKKCRAKTPTRELALTPSSLRKSSKTPIDLNHFPTNLNRPIKTSHQKKKTQSLSHSQSIASRKKSEKSIFNIIHQKLRDKKLGILKTENNFTQSIHVNVKSFESSLKQSNNINNNYINKKFYSSIPLKVNKKRSYITKNKNHNNNSGHSLSLENSNHINSNKFLNYKKKIEEIKKTKEKAKSKQRSPSAKRFKYKPYTKLNVNNSINLELFTIIDDQFKIHKTSFGNQLYSSPSHINMHSNVSIIGRKTNIPPKAHNQTIIKGNKPKVNRIPIKSKSPILTKTNFLISSQTPISTSLNNSIIIKKYKPTNTQITIQANRMVVMNNSNKPTLKEYPNRVNMLNKSNTKNEIRTPLTFNNTIKTGRKIFKIDSITKKGFAGEGIKKVNQDGLFIYNNLNNEDNCILFGICDGHGINGHDVKDYLISTLPISLHKSLSSKHVKSISSTNQLLLNSIIIDTFFKVNTNLILSESIDSTFSGSTCVSLIYTPSHLICANVGDSRCVVGKLEDSGKWKALNLSNDHKPSNVEEMKRIIGAGGRIEAYKDMQGNFVGPERVWVKDDDVPGLAMSRSFGDDVAQSVGVIPLPEIVMLELKQEDKFAILASDGIWEFISSDECVTIVKNYYINKDVAGALEHLYREATKRWIMEEEVIDDITAIIIFFE